MIKSLLKSLNEMIYNNYITKDITIEILDYMNEASIYKSGYMILELDEHSKLSFYYSNAGEISIEYDETKEERYDNIIYVLDCKVFHENIHPVEELKLLEGTIFLKVLSVIFGGVIKSKSKFENIKYSFCYGEIRKSITDGLETSD